MMRKLLRPRDPWFEIHVTHDHAVGEKLFSFRKQQPMNIAGTSFDALLAATQRQEVTRVQN